MRVSFIVFVGIGLVLLRDPDVLILVVLVLGLLFRFLIGLVVIVLVRLIVGSCGGLGDLRGLTADLLFLVIILILIILVGLLLRGNPRLSDRDQTLAMARNAAGVREHDDGKAAAAQYLNDIHEPVDIRRLQIAGGLIKDQVFRVGHDGASQADLLDLKLVQVGGVVFSEAL